MSPAATVDAPDRGDRSLIAGANAWFRAKESTLPAGRRILVDPYAERLAERDPRVQAVRFGRFLLPPLGRAIDELRAAHCVRHRAIDELVLRAVEQDGFRQVVVIGAGYDMRPSRFAARLDGVRWIEVDHPATQARKVRILGGMPGVRAVERAGTNLDEEPLAAVLARTGFDRAQPTCFVLEGIAHYLPLIRFEELLTAMAGLAPCARVIVSFIESAMYKRATPTFVRLIRTMQEIPLLFFAPWELERLCAARGLGEFRTWTFDDQVRDFLPPAVVAARRPRARLSQDVAQATTGGG